MFITVIEMVTFAGIVDADKSAWSTLSNRRYLSVEYRCARAVPHFPFYISKFTVSNPYTVWDTVLPVARGAHCVLRPVAHLRRTVSDPHCYRDKVEKNPCQATPW